VYILLFKQFVRSRTVLITLGILLLLGCLSVGTGRQFLSQKQDIVDKAFVQQAEHIERQTSLHEDDLGLLLYYLKFSFIKPLQPLAGFSIGQGDLHSHVQNVSILNLEGQKYDTDLVNPMHLHVGNLDLSFLIIFLFPLVIIALSFNILSDEVEKGTWRMITVQAKSPFSLLLVKFSIRIVFVFLILGFLFLLAKVVLLIPWTNDLISIMVISYAYLLFWFSLCFFIVLLKLSSNSNAIVLLTCWLILVVFLPVVVNNYVSNKYPVEEAYSLALKQRDEYHKKWDTDKKETMEKFYAHYPQFSKYELEEEGFSWLWYYAMQQMGDDESAPEREAMYEKIKKREEVSTQISRFFPPLQIQLAMNDIAQTSLTHQLAFLDATTIFHEEKRLYFYPMIFENQSASSIEWENQQPEFFYGKRNSGLLEQLANMLLFIILILVIGGIKYLKY